MWMFSRKFALAVLLICVLTVCGGDAVKCWQCDSNNDFKCSSFNDPGKLEECGVNSGAENCKFAVTLEDPTTNRTATIRSCALPAGACFPGAISNLTYYCFCNTEGCNKNCDWCFDSSIPWPTTVYPPTVAPGGGTGSGGSNKVMYSLWVKLLLPLFFFLLD